MVDRHVPAKVALRGAGRLDAAGSQAYAWHIPCRGSGMAKPLSPPQPREVKVFRNNRSQAVRIPAEVALPGDRVRISRDGDRLILEPVGRRISWRSWQRSSRSTRNSLISTRRCCHWTMIRCERTALSARSEHRLRADSRSFGCRRSADRPSGPSRHRYEHHNRHEHHIGGRTPIWLREARIGTTSPSSRSGARCHRRGPSRGSRRYRLWTSSRSPRGHGPSSRAERSVHRGPGARA